MIAHHALELMKLGAQVRVIAGSGGTFDPCIETRIYPLVGSKHPDILAAKKTLDAGQIPENFDWLAGQIAAQLREATAGCDILIVHNAHTMNKNLPLTAALRTLTDEGGLRMMAWVHDLAWTNEQYLDELHEGDPWALLKQAWPNTRYVTISEARQAELAGLTGLPPEQIEIITAGLDLPAFLNWGQDMIRAAGQLSLLDADRILITPARLTRRKNIELALHVLAALRQRTGEDDRLIVTGPPGPHNPQNMGYLGDLLALRHALRLDSAAHFLYELGGETPFIPDDALMANLFGLADGLLFPSTQEGFGIPILEAGLARLPIFCSDLPPFRETAGEDALYFLPSGTPPEAIAADIQMALADSPVSRLRRRVRQHYRWDSIIRSRLIPLLSEGTFE
ncbi:MAG: glycosyltransferase family 4 protein [Anaerolineae bacterium]|nr:glycosyltransferase family 4 protein [Anaerolineae bacterium]